MVSINPNIFTRINAPTLSGTATSTPTGALSGTPTATPTFVPSGTADVPVDLLLVNNGVTIKKSSASPVTYDVTSWDDFEKLKNSGKLKPGDFVTVRIQGKEFLGGANHYIYKVNDAGVLELYDTNDPEHPGYNC